MNCARCNRPLKRPTASGFGPVCERNVLGTKPKRERSVQPVRDPKTADLFEERRA